PVDLLAQIADVDGDHVRPVLVADVPTVLEQLEAGEHLTGTAHEELEERVLLARQTHFRLTAPDPLRRGVEAEVADLDQGRPLGGPTADERSQPGAQLGKRERLP